MTSRSKVPASETPASSRRDELLGDERVSARALGHEQQRRRGSTAAVDRLDQLAQFRSIEGRELRTDHRRGRGEGCERGLERVRADEAVGLVRGHQHQTLPPRNPRQEGHETASRCVGVVQILEHQDDRLALSQALQQTQDRLEGPSLAPFDSHHSRPLWQQFERGESRLNVGHEMGDGIPGRADERRQHLVGHGTENCFQSGGERGVGNAGRSRQGHAVDRDEWFRQRGDPAARLREETSVPHAGSGREKQRVRLAVGGALEAQSNPFELPLAPNESVAPDPVARSSQFEAATPAASVEAVGHRRGSPKGGVSPPDASRVLLTSLE